MDAFLGDLLLRGTVLGLAAGFSPGPLTVLVVSETLRHGLRSGLMVALAPLLTDLPIIALAVFLLDRLADRPAMLGAIAVLGAGYLFHLGWESLRPPRSTELPASPAPRALLRGVGTNFLNPNPYIFWIGVGTPLLLEAGARSGLHAVAFAGPFFVFLVGSKLVLARLVDRSRGFLGGKAFRRILALLGLCLMAYGVLLLREGVRRLAGA
ncbi:MAG: LysE family translocator [Desulfobacterales bacterium]